MEEKLYGEKEFTMIINIAKQYVDDKGVRHGIIAKCYEEIGRLVAGEQGKTTFYLDTEESSKLRIALRRWGVAQRRNSTLPE